MPYVYKVGDIFVSVKLGVITILEVKTESQNPVYKCKVYDKKTTRDTIQYLGHDLFTAWRDYQVYKFYPVKL